MASNINGLVFVLLAVANLLHGSVAKTFTVGDGLGWTIPSVGSQFYVNWATNKTFTSRDTLVFNYQLNAHAVAWVTKSDFDSCNGTNALAVMTKPPAKVFFNLSTVGQQYFICTFPGHCSAGQKLSIFVDEVYVLPTSSPTAPVPSPVQEPAPTATTSPAPATVCSNGTRCDHKANNSRSITLSPTRSPSPTGNHSNWKRKVIIAQDGNKSLSWRSEFGWAAFCGHAVGKGVCGKCLNVTNKENGIIVSKIVRIVDTCTNGGLKLDIDVFQKLDSFGTGNAQGYLMVDYEFVDCDCNTKGGNCGYISTETRRQAIPRNACSPQSRGASACLKVNGSTTMRPTQTPPPTQAPTPTRTSSLLLPSPISPRLKVVCSNGTHCPNATADNSSITLSSAPAPTPTPIQHIHRATTGSDSNWKRTVVIGIEVHI
ncbi:beta-mannanase/endoglucanase A isoform X3 [Medicago truncatula]|uniref:beta-mannanase/endoglucanase A isoform X3 n=1 Tax=Medicago truncatula TaxID=3880 RepID=UPI0019678156|nr:beta-mannanase/endoglucanase A isoform X3 [Medicago truncatula]